MNKNDWRSKILLNCVLKKVQNRRLESDTSKSKEAEEENCLLLAFVRNWHIRVHYLLSQAPTLHILRQMNEVHMYSATFLQITL
jgi:hypothetical protein